MDITNYVSTFQTYLLRCFGSQIIKINILFKLWDRFVHNLKSGHYVMRTYLCCGWHRWGLVICVTFKSMHSPTLSCQHLATGNLLKDVRVVTLSCCLFVSGKRKAERRLLGVARPRSNLRFGFVKIESRNFTVF